jgi:mycothiol system anti-sigma-R factor
MAGRPIASTARCHNFVAGVVLQAEQEYGPNPGREIGEVMVERQGRAGDRTAPQGDSAMTEGQGVIPCSEAVRQLWDYLDQAVSPEDQAKVEQHLSFCRSCCGELEFANQLRGFLASQSAEELPPHVKARLERFLADL